MRTALSLVLAFAPLSVLAEAVSSPFPPPGTAPLNLPAAEKEVQPAPSGPAVSPELQALEGPAAGQGSNRQSEPSVAAPPDGAPSAVPAAAGAPTDDQLTTTPTATGAAEEQVPPGHPARHHSFFDELHGGISTGFLSTATWLDSFFGDERYEAEISRSQLKIRFDAFREGGTGMDYRRPNFDLRLVLPQLRHRTRLVISGDPNVDVDAASVQPGSGAAVSPKDTERNVTTSLQYVPVETKRSNFSIRAGVKLSGGNVEVLAGPRYRYLLPLDPWDLRFTEEVTWSSESRWQSRTRFDLERPLPNSLFFRSSLEGLWSENVDGYPYALSFIVLHPLDSNRAVQYEWINSFQTRPTDALIEELLVFRYRQRFLREWLFLEIAPQYRFPRERSFEALPGILFRLEMVFGDIGRIF